MYLLALRGVGDWPITWAWITRPRNARLGAVFAMCGSVLCGLASSGGMKAATVFAGGNPRRKNWLAGLPAVWQTLDAKLHTPQALHTVFFYCAAEGG